ncbi:hypothetical protein BH10BAC3_BH10BAC3_13340 [soil metagenome]
MKKFIIIAVLFAINQQLLNAQGCVAVRQMGGLNALFSSSYNLQKGSFQVGANYRYFHSWRHFVGTEEQPQRQNTGGGIGADGVDHGNAVNIYSHALDLNLSYAVSNRLQVNLTLPYVHNERSQVLRQKAPVVDTFRYSVYAQGLGDVRMSVNYWIFNPELAHNGNLMVGAGLKLPTGKHDVVDQAPQSDGTHKFAIMDQAIQPGDGGLGFSIELQGFVKLYKSLYGFANGYYLFNPRQSNGTFKSAPKPGLEGYNVYASPDQYFARAGVMAGIGKAKKLTLSLAGRFEGIPAYDAFGGQVAYRRPGYVVAIEPGISYVHGQSTFSLFVPYNFIKNRIQSAADIADQKLQNSKITDPSKYVHVQGDAAFADYSISLGYSYRIAKKAKKSAASVLVPSSQQ